MIMEILTGSGGDSVLVARYTGGGILSSSTKKSGGDNVRGGFCPTLVVCMSHFGNILHILSYAAHIIDCKTAKRCLHRKLKGPKCSKCSQMLQRKKILLNNDYTMPHMIGYV